MASITVGIGDFAVSSNPNDTIVTYALGPCLGVVCYDAERTIAGMVHCQLPLSLDDKEQAKLRPARYVDSGVTLLLNKMQEQGADLSKLLICVAGGAQINTNDSVFKVAQRNCTVFRKLMWKNGLVVTAEDVGGDRPRTMFVDVGIGEVYVKKDNDKIPLLTGNLCAS